MSKNIGISSETRHTAAAQELSTRLSLRDTTMFGYISISIAIFSIVFSSSDPNLQFLLIIIPFVSWGAALLFRYHDETLGLLSLFMCELELEEKNSENYWHAQKGEWQTLAHNRGAKTLRRAQYFFFIGIPFIAIIIWIYFHIDTFFCHYWNVAATISAFVAFYFSASNIIKSTKFRKLLSNKKKLLREKTTIK